MVTWYCGGAHFSVCFFFCVSGRVTGMAARCWLLAARYYWLSHGIGNRNSVVRTMGNGICHRDEVRNRENRGCTYLHIYIYAHNKCRVIRFGNGNGNGNGK